MKHKTIYLAVSHRKNDENFTAVLGAYATKQDAINFIENYVEWAKNPDFVFRIIATEIQ